MLFGCETPEMFGRVQNFQNTRVSKITTRFISGGRTVPLTPSVETEFRFRVRVRRSRSGLGGRRTAYVNGGAREYREDGCVCVCVRATPYMCLEYTLKYVCVQVWTSTYVCVHVCDWSKYVFFARR